MTGVRDSEVHAFQNGWAAANELVGNDGPKGMRTIAGLEVAFDIHDMPKTTVAQALTEYGQAMRGDWSDIDGRSVEIDMGTLSTALFSTGVSLGALRNELGLCPHGKGQWIHWCSSYCKEEEE